MHLYPDLSERQQHVDRKRQTLVSAHVKSPGLVTLWRYCWTICHRLVGLPKCCDAVKVEIIVTTDDKETSPEYEDVYRVHLSQLVENATFTSRNISSVPERTKLPAKPYYSRTILLESYYEVDPNAPLCVRVERKPDDPSDSFTRPTGLAMVKVTPLQAPARAYIVQDVSGYNSWPMLQAIGNKLVCVYSRGSAHSIGEDARAVYARTSTDNGKTWTKETVVADTPKYGEVEVGKGLDANGTMLLWVRRIGSGGWFSRSLPHHRRCKVRARGNTEARGTAHADYRRFHGTQGRTHGAVVSRETTVLMTQASRGAR